MLTMKILTPEKIAVIILKLKPYHFLFRVIFPKDADRMANRVDPDQTAPVGAVWSGLHCLSENLGSLWYSILHFQCILKSKEWKKIATLNVDLTVILQFISNQCALDVSIISRQSEVRPKVFSAKKTFQKGIPPNFSLTYGELIG